MLDIINKKNAFIAAASVLFLIAFMLLFIGGVTLGKGCVEQTFNVITLEDGSKTLMTTIDGKPVVPNSIGKLDISGETMTLWYNPVDNAIITNYYLQTWGFLIAGVALGITGALILKRGFKKKRFV